MTRVRPTAAAATLVLSCLAAHAAPAQRASWYEASGVGELQAYLRVLQGIGAAPSHPWSLRAFAPHEIDRLLASDSAHPWAGRFGLPDPAMSRVARVLPIRPATSATYNSGRPVSGNDGAVWAGRGATMSLHGGLVARVGIATLVLDPVLFWTQNASFPLHANGLTGSARFGDPLYAAYIDQPQRFGDGAFARLEPGQSTLRVDVLGLAVGVSTANEVWGPAEHMPLVLGANAPGIPRAFVGSSMPMNLWIGRLHGRLELGRLSQSAYSAAPAGTEDRLMSGVVVVFTPRGVPGLELGGSRFFHRVWPEGGPSLDDFTIPFEGLLKSTLRTTDSLDGAQNQLGGVFLRWVLPRLEVYGELAREDHNADLRDLLGEPDHSSAYLLGMRRYWSDTDRTRVTVLRGELVNARTTHLARVRSQSPFYVHTQLKQGHTHRGQLLGSPAAFGGAGSVLGVDRYHPGGRWSAEWSRVVRQHPPAEGSPEARWNVLHSLAASATLFRRSWEMHAGVAGDYQIGRPESGDAFGLRVDLGARVPLGLR